MEIEYRNLLEYTSKFNAIVPSWDEYLGTRSSVELSVLQAKEQYKLELYDQKELKRYINLLEEKITKAKLNVQINLRRNNNFQQLECLNKHTLEKLIDNIRIRDDIRIKDNDTNVIYAHPILFYSMINYKGNDFMKELKNINIDDALKQSSISDIMLKIYKKLYWTINIDFKKLYHYVNGLDNKIKVKDKVEFINIVADMYEIYIILKMIYSKQEKQLSNIELALSSVDETQFLNETKNEVFETNLSIYIYYFGNLDIIRQPHYDRIKFENTLTPQQLIKKKLYKLSFKTMCIEDVINELIQIIIQIHNLYDENNIRLIYERFEIYYALQMRLNDLFDYIGKSKREAFNNFINQEVKNNLKYSNEFVKTKRRISTYLDTMDKQALNRYFKELNIGWCNGKDAFKI